MQNFLIRCDANKNNGFGHFSRCLNLARGIRHKLPKARIVFLGDYDNVPTQLIEKYNMVKKPLFDLINEEVNFARGFDVFRGSEDDVLERFYLAAKSFNPDYIARITGDCPCLDPIVCDRLFKMFLKQKVDHAELSPDYPEGADCEIFTFEALEDAYKKSTLKSEREHVSLDLNNNTDLYNKILLDNTTDDSRYRITIEEEDFIVVKSIFEALYNGKSSWFSLDDIKNYLDLHPDIFKLNSHIIRNEGLQISLENDSIVKGTSK